MADFLMTRARRLFQYVNLHGSTMPPDVSTNNNRESHFSNGMSSVRITNDSGSHLVGENLHNNLNGASLQHSSSSPNGSITNVSKLIRQKKQKRIRTFLNGNGLHKKIGSGTRKIAQPWTIQLCWSIVLAM